MSRVPSAAALHVGRQIYELRKARGMRPEQLAYEAGIDSANLRAYENGRALPGLHTLLRIATALGTDPGSVIEGLTLEHFAELERRRKSS